MASSQPVKRQIQHLDPTKLATLNIVRRPPIPKHAVIQGKPRELGSNAHIEFQKQEGARLRKALERLTHGRNIFVYNNIRTNQVVYSLTRYLEKNNALNQLIFHGKKTVPSHLRKDMWVPYYSVHFDNDKVGLRAYHLLREFSMQRQLAPPREMITITEDFLEQKRPRDPQKAKEFDEKYKPKIGAIMEKKHRARVLMDQKATSVADIAAVLAIQEDEIKNGFGEHDPTDRQPRRKNGRLPQREVRRLKALSREDSLNQQALERVAELERNLSSLAMEVKVVNPEGYKEYRLNQRQVKILWNDLHNARYAQSWPERVLHGELELTTDHVMPGQKSNGVDIVAEHAFAEKKQPSPPASSS